MFPEHYFKWVPNPEFETHRISITQYLCPYCHRELLETTRIDTEANKSRTPHSSRSFRPSRYTSPRLSSQMKRSNTEPLLEEFERAFQGQIKNKELGLTDDEKAGKLISREYTRFPKKHFTCPHCEETVLVHPWTDRQRTSIHKHEYSDYTKIRKHLLPLTIKTHSYIPEELRITHFWNCTRSLTNQGLKTLTNQFIAHANPIVTQLEAMICQFISKATWNEYFRMDHDRREILGHGDHDANSMG